MSDDVPESGPKTPPEAEQAERDAAPSDAAEGAPRPEERRGSEGSSEEPPLLVPGNRPRLVRGGALTLLGGLAALRLMGADRHVPLGVPLGIVAVLVATLGVLDLLGSFDDAESRVAARIDARSFLGPVALVLGCATAFAAVAVLSTRGTLTVLASAILAPTTFLALVAAVFRAGVTLGPFARDEAGEARPLLRRHGFWVLAVGAAVALPTAGAHSLTDPWETHYGEVAREVLSRDDWISTWWAQDGWFFSKPVLNFWMQALAMASLGVKYEPDQLLAAAMTGPTPRPEWAVRLPVVLFAILASYLLYKGVARVFGRRAGMLGAIVLWTMPQWSMLSHQTMADMPFVAALTSAMGLFLLGIYTDEDREAPVYEVRMPWGPVRLSAFHVAFGVILLSALPQALYLISRNLEWVTDKHGFRWHADVFWSGSKGNCGLPGNEACVVHHPAIRWLAPGWQGAAWLAVTGILLYLNWGERRISRLCFLVAYYFAAISTLGKGPAGILLPVACVVVYVVVTGRWRDLSRAELLSGGLILLAVALPWYVAMHVRHGPQFIDRLIFHDMWKRALTHVHDTNEGDDTSFRFYLWQLGYAFFPWTGLVPTALVWWARRPDDAARGKGDASIFLAMWFVFAFALFSAMLTKFHHYIFPAVPPAAMLTGILLDRLLGELTTPDRESVRRTAVHVLAVALGAVLVAYGVFRLFPGHLDGFRGDAGFLRPPSYGLAALFLVLGGGLASWGAAAFLGPGKAPADAEPAALRYESLLLSAAAIGGALCVGIVGRDLSLRPDADVPGDARLMHLFTYNYKRPWPDSLDFTGVLAAVTIATIACVLLLSWPAVRRVATIAMLGLGLSFGAFSLFVYFPKTSPHWGQRETIEAYYKLRKGPEEPFVAYQMNWKGENYYTGNRVPAFVSSGERFKQWIREQRDQGVRTFFFSTEHGRVAALKGELGNPSGLETLTDRRLNNKFTLVRVRFPD